MRRQALLCALTMLVAASVTLLAQAFPSEQIQVGPPLRHTQAPLAGATPQELEQRGDELRGRKSYLDALDYYGSALKKQPRSEERRVGKEGRYRRAAEHEKKNRMRRSR